MGRGQPRLAGVRRRPPQGLRPRDAALPLGRAPRRPPQVLLGRRRDRPLPTPPRVRRHPPDGLRRLRPARREQRDPNGRAPQGCHRALHRLVPRAVQAVGNLPRLDPRGLDPRARLLPLDAVDLPEALRAGPRLPRRSPRPVVPEGPDGPRQRAGHRRPLRALRHARGPAPPLAVVLQDHRLRPAPARRLRPPRILARACGHDAAQLDRPLRGRRGHLPLRRARPRLPRLHDPPGHALRRDVLRRRSRAPRRPQARRGHRARAGGSRLRRRGRPRLDRGPRSRGAPQDRRPDRTRGHQPGERRGDPRLRRRLRPHGLRHRRPDGRPRTRPARLGLRQGVRPADPPGDRARRGRGADRRGVHGAGRSGPDRQLRRVRRPHAGRGRSRRSRPGSTPRAGERRPSTTASATG